MESGFLQARWDSDEGVVGSEGDGGDREEVVSVHAPRCGSRGMAAVRTPGCVDRRAGIDPVVEDGSIVVVTKILITLHLGRVVDTM